MGPFLQACGAAGPLAIDVEGPDAPSVARHVSDQPFLVIGRDPRTDLVLDDEQVSRRHTLVQMVAGQVYGLDLGSRHGTWREDGGQNPGWLERGQSLRIGPFRVRFGGAGPENETEEEARDGWARAVVEGSGPDPSYVLPSLSLDLTTHEQVVKPVTRLLTLLGTKPACTWRLRHESVAGFHTCLVRTPTGPWVVDLLSDVGTVVNGSAVRFAPLEDGDELRIGPFALRVRGGPPTEAKAPRLGDRTRAGVPALRTGRGALSRIAPPGPPSRRTASRTELVPFPAAPSASGLASSDSSLLPLLTQFSLIQQQMFEQFQQTLLMVTQSFGAMHREQSELIRGELDRIDRLHREVEGLKAELSERRPAPAAEAGTAGEEAIRTAPSAPDPAGDAHTVERVGEPPHAPRPPRVASPAEEEYLHRIHQRLAEIQHEGQSRWQNLLKLLPGYREAGSAR